MSPAITRQRQHNADGIVLFMFSHLSQLTPERVMSVALALTRQLANILTVRQQDEWLAQLKVLAAHDVAEEKARKEALATDECFMPDNP